MKTHRKSKLFLWQQSCAQGGVCNGCGKQSEDLTVDHIIPVSWLLQLGAVKECEEWEDNFALLCRKCNAFKANRINPSDEKTVRLLKELINRL